MRVKSTATLIFRSFITCFLNIKKRSLCATFFDRLWSDSCGYTVLCPIAKQKK